MGVWIKMMKVLCLLLTMKSGNGDEQNEGQNLCFIALLAWPDAVAVLMFIYYLFSYAFKIDRLPNYEPKAHSHTSAVFLFSEVLIANMSRPCHPLSHRFHHFLAHSPDHSYTDQISIATPITRKIHNISHSMKSKSGIQIYACWASGDVCW